MRQFEVSRVFCRNYKPLPLYSMLKGISLKADMDKSMTRKNEVMLIARGNLTVL